MRTLGAMPMLRAAAMMPLWGGKAAAPVPVPASAHTVKLAAGNPHNSHSMQARPQAPPPKAAAGPLRPYSRHVRAVAVHVLGARPRPAARLARGPPVANAEAREVISVHVVNIACMCTPQGGNAMRPHAQGHRCSQQHLSTAAQRRVAGPHRCCRRRCRCWGSPWG
jgi:hypothetical protein